jgi:hypothetical protein
VLLVSTNVLRPSAFLDQLAQMGPGGGGGGGGGGPLSAGLPGGGGGEYYA